MRDHDITDDSKFQETLINLILELLRSPDTYPDLVLSLPVDARGEVSPDAVKITQHYTAALQAYGYTLVDSEFKQALKWFAKPFPREQYTRIDTTEMRRLEALIALYEPEAEDFQPDIRRYIDERLLCLSKQRGKRDGNYIIGDSPPFDNLWSLKVMTMAQERGLLDHSLVDKHELSRRVDIIVEDKYVDKDLALALHLRYKHYGSLEDTHKRYLENLIDIGFENGGVWDLRYNLEWLVSQMKSRRLAARDVHENREAFRGMIVSTCYVIENLAPLIKIYPDLTQILDESLYLWWGVLHGEDAVGKLRELFPETVDYLFILCRTIIAMCAYQRARTDQMRPELALHHIYRRLAVQGSNYEGSTERKDIQQALRRWTPIDTSEPEPLKLGLSGANVVRIKPRLSDPMNLSRSLPFVDSLIVKYGPVEEINLERKNYEKLPLAIRDGFVSIPRESHINKQQGRAYVIMADLVDYYTLYEKLNTIHLIKNELLRELGPFLMKMHRGGGVPSGSNQQGLLWQLY